MNPFNPSTVISHRSPVSGQVTLKVYDVLENEIATLVDEYKPAGNHDVKFNVAQVSRPEISSGVYFYQLQAGSFVETKKMILLR
ncbi:MAG: T9SS type A sorting domain-containing protein [Ignavibacteriaceae bacterium]|nr:T9SS type A sorting domain-containing protein [Ignavibacteriaceae bacterium]